MIAEPPPIKLPDAPPESTGDHFGVERESDESRTEKETPIQDSEITRAQAEERTKRLEVDDAHNIVLGWLVQEGIVDQDMFDNFKKQLVEGCNDNPENIDQVYEPSKKLPQLFAEFDRTVDQLSQNKAEYKKVREKQKEIKKSICLSVINGHLAASDIEAMISGIKIVPKPDNMGDVVAEWNLESGEIVIFDSALKDTYKGPDGKKINLNFNHLINHETAHAFTERYLVKNERLLSLCDRLNENQAILDLQPQHAKKELSKLKNIDADWEMFKQNNHLGLTKEQFIIARKTSIAREVITDYTACYMKSDGTLNGFLEKCIAVTDPDAAQSALGVTKQSIEQYLNEKDAVGKQEKLEVLMENGNLRFFVDTLKIFHQEIERMFKENKGQVIAHNEFIGESEGDEELESSGWGDLMNYDQGSNFADNSKKGDTGFWASIAGFIKAFADEAPKVDEVIGGKSAT